MLQEKIKSTKMFGSESFTKMAKNDAEIGLPDFLNCFVIIDWNGCEIKY